MASEFEMEGVKWRGEGVRKKAFRTVERRNLEEGVLWGWFKKEKHLEGRDLE